MRDAMKPVWLVLFAAAAMLAVVGISRMRGTSAAADEKVPWLHDLSAARDQSAKESKPVLAYFTASWCGPCQKMRSTTWSDDRVAAALKAYVPVKIDVDEQSAAAREFGVRSIPRVDVIDPAGNRRTLIEGAVSPDDMLALLHAESSK